MSYERKGSIGTAFPRSIGTTSDHAHTGKRNKTRNKDRKASRKTYQLPTLRRRLKSSNRAKIMCLALKIK